MLVAKKCENSTVKAFIATLKGIFNNETSHFMEETTVFGAEGIC